MQTLNYFFSLKIIKFCLPILLTITCIGLFNGSWYSLILWSTLLLLFFSAILTKNKNRVFGAIFISVLSFSFQNLIELPEIIEGSNVFIGGEKYKNSVFSKELPTMIFDSLNESFILNFPNSISGPDNKLFEKSVTQMVFENNETKKVTSINWKNRYELGLGSFNNANYNAYGEQEPNRQNLPYFIKYTFPKEFDNELSKFCWKGFGYLKKEKLKEVFNSEKNCIKLKDYYTNGKENIEIWLVDKGDNNLEAELISPFEKREFLIKLIKIINSLIIFMLIFSNVNLPKVFKFTFTFFLTFLLATYFNPTILDKFILFEGGNDGLLYVHFAHLIAENISKGNYLDALQGGENIFDLMPFYRYVWIINYLLFEEAPWIFLLTLNMLPLVIFYILKNLLNNRWAYVCMFCWFILPLFEAFGFFHFYYVKLTLRGFAEPLAYLSFFSAIAILIKVLKSNKHLLNSSFLFWIGFLLSMTIGLRANILPACLIMILYILYEGILNRKMFGIIYLAMGLSITLSIPLHNYYYGNAFVPLTIAAYKDWNLGASPSDYFNLFISILNLNFDTIIWQKIVGHINGEIKLYEFWYHFSIFASIFCIFKRNVTSIIRFISFAGLSLISLLFFYHVGGRYSYLAWTLALISLFYFIKNFLLPGIMDFRKKYAS